MRILNFNWNCFICNKKNFLKSIIITMSVFDIEYLGILDFIFWNKKIISEKKKIVKGCYILKFLNYQNVILCGSVSKQFLKLSRHDDVWRELFSSRFGENEIYLRRCGLPPTPYIELFQLCAGVLNNDQREDNEELLKNVICASSFDQSVKTKILVAKWKHIFILFFPF